MIIKHSMIMLANLCLFRRISRV